MQLSEIIESVQSLHPDFSYEEIAELCYDYLAQFNDKTKESTKEKSLKKYLSKEFWIQRETESLGEDFEKQVSFSSIPRHLFNYTNKKNADYLITIKGLSKQLGSTILFEDAELKIKPEDKIALVGKNGAGKSTFLKILLDPELADHGEIELLKDTKIWFLSQDLFRESRGRTVLEEMLTTFPEITRRVERLEEIKQLLDWWNGDAITLIDEQNEHIERMLMHEAYQKYDLQKEILKYFWFTREQLNFPIKKLSGGEQTKLQIAKFLLQDVDLLILDEPTNHLDIEGILFIEQFCQMRNKALICISHDRKFLASAFTKTIEIKNKKLNLYYCGYEDFLREKEKRAELQLKNYTAQQKYLAQQEKFIERFRYKSSKAAQVQSRIKMLDKMDRIEAPEEEISAHTPNLQVKWRLPETLIRLSELSVGYGQSVLVNLPRELEITKAMKIWIIGKNGVGKTTLLKTLLGQLKPLYGDVRIHEKVRIWFYSQVADDLDFQATITEELVWPWVSFKEAMGFLGALLIDPEKADQKIWTLSGGERSKVALAKMLLAHPDIVVMDEPTNHLDLTSKEAIKTMLADFNGVSLIVSHDRDFLEATSELLWVIKEEKLTVFHSFERGFEEMRSRNIWDDK